MQRPQASCSTTQKFGPEAIFAIDSVLATTFEALFLKAGLKSRVLSEVRAEIWLRALGTLSLKGTLSLNRIGTLTAIKGRGGAMTMSKESLLLRARRRVRQSSGHAAQRLGLLPWLLPRRTDISCCGLSKTGTHSMAGLFKAYRAEHHPDRDTRLELAIGSLQGRLAKGSIERLLRRRDRVLWLEMESSTLAGILIEPLARACPTKRFVLTVRDVYSWCNSWFDHNLNFPKESRFTDLDRVRLQPEAFPSGRHDRPLQDRGFFSLAAYFSLWSRHTRRVLDVLPAERLLVVRTHEILARVTDIADFARVPASSLQPDYGWEFRTERKHGVLAALDPGYVSETAERCSGCLMKRFFAEITWEPRSPLNYDL